MPPRRRPCEQYQRGNCRHGAKCNFLHAGPPGMAQASIPPQKADSNPSPSSFIPGLPHSACKPFWLNGKCSRGDQCKFKHIQAGTTNADAPPILPQHRGAGSSSNAPRNPPQNAPQNAPDQIPGLPHMACRTFWQSGTCDDGFRCRYKHLKAGEEQIVIPAQAARVASFTEDNLPELAGPTADAFMSSTLNPSQVKNRMSVFLLSHYKFRRPDEMSTFVTIISNCNAKNPSWTLKDGQEFFQVIAAPDRSGLNRIQDVLCYQTVSANSSGNRTALSFQRTYLPLLAFFASDWVKRTTLRQLVNGLYGLIEVNFDHIAAVIMSCVGQAMTSRSFNEPGNAVSGLDVFRILVSVLYEYVSRYKKAVKEHGSFAILARRISTWLDEWVRDVLGPHPQFNDSVKSLSAASRGFALDKLRVSANNLLSIIERTEGSVTRIHAANAVPGASNLGEEQALANALQMAYDIDGPGNIGRAGPRHDNDHENIEDIKIVPTNEEILSNRPTFLPGNFPRAPHHLPSDSMERLLDIQYRLLREELIAPIRSSVSSVVQDLAAPPTIKTPLTTILKKNGGLYHSKDSGLRFSLYTDVTFGPMKCDSRRELSIELTFDAPNGPARNPSANKRVAYWEGVGKKRLMQGGLVALLWKPAVTADPVKVYLAVISSSLRDILDNVRASAERISIRASFFESEAELRILHSLLKQEDLEDDTRLLIEAPVMFESIRPFLQTIKTREPTDIPFSRYLAFPTSDDLAAVTIDPPRYVVPGFKYDLSVLFDQPAAAPLQLFPMDPMSGERARIRLKEGSQLDPSQADALVDALTSEVSLIQGPPGTGKSYTGIKLLRVLIANKIGPILLIAFTNHALDNILSQVLEKGISRKIIRLGSRSADENVAPYSLDEITKKLPRDRSGNAAYGKMKDTEDAMAKLMEKVVKTEMDEADIVDHISLMNQQHHALLNDPPYWIRHLFDESLNSDWQTAGGKGQEPKSLLGYWLACKDLAFLTPPDPPPRVKNPRRVRGKGKENADVAEAIRNRYVVEDGNGDERARASQAPDSYLNQWRDTRLEFFKEITSMEWLPEIPEGERDLDDLLDDPEVWDMSQAERGRLAGYWAQQARELAYTDRADEFDRLKLRYAEARLTWSEVMDKAKLEVLSTAELIGCTTNGAAKLTELLASVAPKVLLVEEAGQVLEAHVLASLVPSIQHMILIGDPLQLRPTLENYDLSVDNKRTGHIYRFDRSVMERLSDMGLKMSQLDVQRRMRPRISELIRSTLYPNLEDHDVVQHYPSVRGMAKDVFFLDHRHAEGGGDDDPESVSKTNMFEVLMIKDLVLYFLRQGNYSGQGDIVVLCAYLGQLSQIRKALSNEVTTVIDERDAVLLVDEEDADSDDDAPVKSQFDTVASHVKVSTRVLLRTVDNFQGEEGKIIILSLVRNSGANPSRGKGIGFLRSANRANVALSRAREGMYILGNADDLCSPKDCHFWRGVVGELKAHNQIGPAFPIACNLHPTTMSYIDEPGQLPMRAPDGGCTLPCDQRLSCGHHCPLKCHSYDIHHTVTTCPAPCVKLCPRDHPCDKPCYMKCGKCNFPMSIELACGHVNDVRCWQLDDPESIPCTVRLSKPLPGCEHTAIMTCSTDPITIQCLQSCDRRMACCGKRCSGNCDGCQRLNYVALPNGRMQRTLHTSHPCGKSLYCQHFCEGDCSDEHSCSDVACTAQCRQVCQHNACNKPCSMPCAPCMEPCVWQCKHHECSVVCGAPCARLPCNTRCENQLQCGHQCPSVCGEPCELQICPLCVTGDAKDQVVDMVMQTTLAEIDPNGEELDELLITLACRHTFTVETLDGICEINQYYKGRSGQWTDLATPPAGLQKAPVCPLCRGFITSLRYGRIFKRSDLDRSEQNVANNGRRVLMTVGETLATHKAKAGEPARLVKAAFKKKPKGKGKDVDLATEADVDNPSRSTSFISPSETLPVPSSLLGAGASSLFGDSHGLPKSLVTAWRNAARGLFAAYDAAYKIAMSTSAHRQVYDAAVSTLYHQKIAAMATQDETFDDGPVAHGQALDFAKSRCGLAAPPKADIRFRVEACWISFNLRFELVEIAEAITAHLITVTDSKPVQAQWTNFIDYIYNSVERDAALAVQLADDSQCHRQAAKTVLRFMDAVYLRFSVRVTNETSPAAIRLLKAEARYGCTKAKATLAERTAVYRNAMNGNLEDVQWSSENFVKPATAIVDKWAALSQRLEQDTPLTDDEKREIIKALAQGTSREAPIATRGHFYQCPNGHVYVIADCGGAVNRSRCPECGAVIGGSNHQLDSTNSRATDFEAIARDAGVEANPFPWGRGA